MGASNTSALYHGGVPGLLPGDLLLPPAVTGARSCADYDPEHCRSDRVYLTTDREEAAVYAAVRALGGGGDVYEVEPMSELEPDPPDLDTTTSSYATRAATVHAVVRRAVPVAEALARMRMAVATLETARLDAHSYGAEGDVDVVTFLALARHTK